MSRFDDDCLASAPDHLDQFGEPVIVQWGEVSIEATAILDLEEPYRDVELRRQTVFQGKAKFLATDRDSLIPDTRTPLRVIAKGYSWYVVDVLPDKGGLFEMFLQTELADQSHAVDLEGNQHRYG